MREESKKDYNAQGKIVSTFLCREHEKITWKKNVERKRTEASFPVYFLRNFALFFSFSPLILAISTFDYFIFFS